MKPNRLVVVSMVLLLAGIAASAQAPDRSKPPASGPAPALKLPAIQKRQLSNGLPVWIVELHEVPVAQVNLVVLSGTADDPAGKYGIASLTAAMLAEGAGSRTSLEIADAVEFLGADMGAASGIDNVAIRLHVPVARLADALPIMADVALRFPGGFEATGDISRRLEEVLTYRLPDDYFSNYVQKIEAVTAADVQRVARKYIDPSKLAVVVVGDVKTIEAGVKSVNLGPMRTLTIDEVFGPAPQMSR